MSTSSRETLAFTVGIVLLVLVIALIVIDEKWRNELSFLLVFALIATLIIAYLPGSAEYRIVGIAKAGGASAIFFYTIWNAFAFADKNWARQVSDLQDKVKQLQLDKEVGSQSEDKSALAVCRSDKIEEESNIGSLERLYADQDGTYGKVNRSITLSISIQRNNSNPKVCRDNATEALKELRSALSTLNNMREGIAIVRATVCNKSIR